MPSPLDCSLSSKFRLPSTHQKTKCLKAKLEPSNLTLSSNVDEVKETWTVYSADGYFKSEVETFDSTAALLQEMKNRDLSGKPARYTKERIQGGPQPTRLDRLKKAALVAAKSAVRCAAGVGGTACLIGGVLLIGQIGLTRLGLAQMPGALPAAMSGLAFGIPAIGGAIYGAVKGFFDSGRQMSESSLEGKLQQSESVAVLKTAKGASIQLKERITEQDAYQSSAKVLTGSEFRVRRQQRKRDGVVKRTGNYLSSQLLDYPNLKGELSLILPSSGGFFSRSVKDFRVPENPGNSDANSQNQAKSAASKKWKNIVSKAVTRGALFGLSAALVANGLVGSPGLTEVLANGAPLLVGAVSLSSATIGLATGAMSAWGKTDDVDISKS